MTQAYGRRDMKQLAGRIRASETDECRAFVSWTRYVRYRGDPLFERVVKIPNERGKRSVMTAILVAIGMKAGFPDYSLLAPLGPYAGLYLEAKRIGGRVDDAQQRWRDRLNDWGYRAEICEGSLELIDATRRYMAHAPASDWYDVPISIEPDRGRR